MTKSYFKLNGAKTELLLFHTKRMNQPATTWTPPPILGKIITPSAKVKSLGVIFDSHMTMDAQIGSVVSGSHHLLRLLHRLTPFIPKEDIAVVVGAIVNSRLDYANALYLARLVTGKNPW